MDVPAASWECWDHGVDLHKRAPPARATNPKTGGRLTQETAGSNPTTGQAAVIFNLDLDDCASEVSLWRSPTACRRSVHIHRLLLVGGRGMWVYDGVFKLWVTSAGRTLRGPSTVSRPRFSGSLSGRRKSCCQTINTASGTHRGGVCSADRCTPVHEFYGPRVSLVTNTSYAPSVLDRVSWSV